MSWCEIGMIICFGINWPFSVRTMLKTKQTEGKSFVLPWLFVLGCVFAICYKLFVRLDLVILLYVTFACFAFADYRICKRLRLFEAADLRRSELMKRGRLSGTDGSRASDSGRSRHHHHRRRERSLSGGYGERGGETDATNRLERETTENAVPKEPIFADDIKFDDE